MRTWPSPIRLSEDSHEELLADHGLSVYAISAHLVGQAVCDHPIDQRHQAILPGRIWGDGDPEGVRTRAAAELKDVARVAAELEVDTVVGFTGSSIWHTLAMFPPVPESMIDAGYQDFADRWNPILDVFDELGVRFAHEVHPSEIAYDYWTTQRALQAVEHRPAFGLNFDPSHFVWQDLDPLGVPLGLPRPDLSRRFQGHQEAPRRPQRPAGVASGMGGPAPRLGLRVHRSRRRRLRVVRASAECDRL